MIIDLEVVLKENPSVMISDDLRILIRSSLFSALSSVPGVRWESAEVSSASFFHNTFQLEK